MALYVSSIDQARITSAFDLNWSSYNGQSDVINYTIFRQYANNPEQWIAAVGSGVTNYTDTYFKSSHALYMSVMYENSALSYKVVANKPATSSKEAVSFLVFPHTAMGMVQCRSTKLQVKNNILFDEGEMVWLLKNSTNNSYNTQQQYKEFARLAVDPTNTAAGGGRVLIGEGWTHNWNLRYAKAMLVSLSGGDIQQLYSIDSAANIAYHGNAVSGPVMHPTNAGRITLGTNNYDTANRPIVTQFNGNTKLDYTIPLTVYNGGPQTITDASPPVFTFNLGNYIYNGINYGLFDITRLNLIGLNLDSLGSNTIRLWGSADSEPSQFNAIDSAYAMCISPDKKIFLNTFRFLTPDLPSSGGAYFGRIFELSNRLSNPSLGKASLPRYDHFQNVGNGSYLRTVATDGHSKGAYWVYTTIDILGQLVRIWWNGTNFDTSKIEIYKVGFDSNNYQWYAVSFDGYNCPWLVGNTYSVLKLYDQNLDVNQRYPTKFQDFSGNSGNNRYIEYVLTRDTGTMSALAKAAWLNIVQDNSSYSYLSPIETGATSETVYFDLYRWGGVRIKGSTLSEQITNAQTWINTYALSNGITGRRLFPHQNPANIVWQINSSNPSGFYYSLYPKNWTTNLLGVSREFSQVGISINSNVQNETGFAFSLTEGDFTGTSFVNATNTNYDDMVGAVSPLSGGNVPPVYNIPPSVSLVLETVEIQDSLNETWPVFTDTNSVSAFDNLHIVMHFDTIVNSYTLSAYKFKIDDYAEDFESYTGPNIITSVSGLSADISYIYHDPNTRDWINRWMLGREAGDSHTITIGGTAYFNKGSPSYADPYTVSSLPVSAITIFERWPTADFSVSGFDLSALRDDWYGYAIWKKINTSERNITISPVFGETYTTILSGTDPLSAIFYDDSIARTWPVSSWYFDACDILYGGFGDINQSTWTTDDATVLSADSIRNGVQMFSHIYRRPGTYFPTMYVQASNSNTYSNSAYPGAPSTVEYVAVSARVDVLEYEPFANFFTLSGITYLSSYSDDLTGYNPPTVAVSVNSNVISGYSPNLTVTFQDTSIPHSFPISSWNWNFGDYYNELSNTIQVTAGTSDLLTTYPTWTNNKTGHKVDHTYVMPGWYDVSLCVQTSTTSMQDCSAKVMHVYVEEIPPQACFEMSTSLSGFSNTTTLTGNENLTVYFTPSCTIPGSFPICKIDYMFGDGTTETIYRDVTATPLSAQDPRDIIVSHTYTVTYGTSGYVFTPSITVYACNTNTSDTTDTISTSAIVIVYPPTVNPNIQAAESRPMHLIGNRLYDDKLFISMEGTDNGNVYMFLIPDTTSKYLSGVV